MNVYVNEEVYEKIMGEIRDKLFADIDEMIRKKIGFNDVIKKMAEVIQ